MRELRKVLIVGMVLGAVVVKAQAAELYVPSQYPTIQAAINAVATGDTVRVSAGTYTEVVYVNKGIGLVGVGTP
ncbi:hypothetical protein KKH65_05540, partial [bacterium]|nr:hypothetical protein [bacterium]